jgi:amino acid transporter
MENETPTAQRHLGLVAATGVGVGAIVGGGILALAGVAFATTGPAAILAFGLNGVIALLTALSFAEMSSKFPESGGTYTFARKCSHSGQTWFSVFARMPSPVTAKYTLPHGFFSFS